MHLTSCVLLAFPFVYGCINEHPSEGVVFGILLTSCVLLAFLFVYGCINEHPSEGVVFGILLLFGCFHAFTFSHVPFIIWVAGDSYLFCIAFKSMSLLEQNVEGSICCDRHLCE